ncbi:MAG: hypothetical protein GXP54_05420 [Deltaproteobacteria bacterium]|nr:hypothetical protein [Deltaproteobacteria bacterium]
MKKTVLLLMVGVMAACACGKDNMAERQKAALKKAKGAVRQEADKVLSGWLEQMVQTLPKDVKKYPKVKSPLVGWRLKSLEYDWRRPLGAAVVKARGTPFEDEMKAIPEFFNQLDLFWHKKIDFKDYMKAWAKLKESTDDPLANLLADFDHTFVHLEAFYGAQDMEGDDRAIYFFRHWQVAFNFPREHHEAVSDYLARLCKAKLSDYCRTVPFEVMHFAMEKPYLNEAVRIVHEFMDKYKDCKLNRVFKPYLIDVKKRLATMKDFKENPVVPETISKAPYVGDLKFTVSRAGIEYEGLKYIDFSKGWEGSPASWRSMSSQMGKVQKRLVGLRGPENMELMVVSMDKNAPMSIPARLVSIFSRYTPRYIDFGARRRRDGINRKATLGRLQFREVPVKARTLGVQGDGVLKCKPLGVTDDSEDLPARISTVVFLGPDEIRVGTLKNGKVVDVAPMKQAGALNRLAGGVGLLAVDAAASYDRFIRFIDPLFLACEDPECQNVKDLKPLLEVQVCSK